mgnify:CR=1 FL=1
MSECAGFFCRDSGFVQQSNQPDRHELRPKKQAYAHDGWLLERYGHKRRERMVLLLTLLILIPIFAYIWAKSHQPTYKLTILGVSFGAIAAPAIGFAPDIATSETEVVVFEIGE